MSEGQILSAYFCDALKVKASSSQFTKFIYIFNSLLKTWNKEELESVIEYISRHPLKSPVYSPAYLQYVMQETLLRVASERLKSTTDVIIDIPKDEVDLKELNASKYTKENSLINNSKMVKF